jgi:hypothetical protein
VSVIVHMRFSTMLLLRIDVPDVHVLHRRVIGITPGSDRWPLADQILKELSRE